MPPFKVQETNEYSTLSKRSMMETGYFKDDFLPYFTQKFSRRSPLINLGYFVRAKIIESSMVFFLDAMKNIDNQILSLGAGFDTSYFRLFEKMGNTKYFEIDYLDVAHQKITYIMEDTEIIADLLGEMKAQFLMPRICDLNSGNYNIMSRDMGDLKCLKFSLISKGFDFSKPTLVLSECAIIYMAETKSTRLIRWAANELSNAVFLTYEQINPKDGFGTVMKQHFMNNRCPLRSLDKYRTMEDQQERYLSCGWSESECLSAYDIYDSLLSEEEHNKTLKLEPFDEWEEWHLKCCHYVLTIASIGSLQSVMLPFIERVNRPIEENRNRRKVKWDLHKDIFVQRYGHCTVSLGISNNIFLFIGGFANIEGSTHSRPNHASLIMAENKLVIDKVFQDFNCLGMYCGCTILSKMENKIDFLLYGGRTSPVKYSYETPVIVSISFDEETVHESKDFKLQEEKIIVEGIQPSPRWRHSLEVIGNSLYVFGGRDRDVEVWGDLWTLNLNSSPKVWRKVEGNGQVPEKRFSHSSVVSGLNMYILGGLSDTFKPLSDCWMFNTETEIWKEIPISGMLPRYNHTSHLIDNFILLIGGVNTLVRNQPGVGLIDLKNGKCAEFSLPVANEKLPIMLHNHSSVLSVDEKNIYVTGGGGNCFSFGTSFNKCIIEIPLSQFF